MFIVIFNGPPGCGKDTGAHVAVETMLKLMDKDDDHAFFMGGARPEHFKFATPLKQAVHHFFGMGSDSRLHHQYEDIKDVRRAETYYKSLRELYISISETWAKPMFGANVFAELMVNKIKNWSRSTGCQCYVISDIGFQNEIDVMNEKFMKADILLIHVIRKGHTFANDSRSYVSIDPSKGCFETIHNNGTKEEFNKQVKEVVTTWMGSMIARRSM